MLIFQKLELHNQILFKHAVFDLDYEGTTVINGLNLNAKTKRANGAGKSSLIGSIPRLRYGTAPIVTSAKNQAKKDGFRGKGSSIDLVWSQTNTEKPIVNTCRKYQTSDKSSFKYDVTVDGESKDFHTATPAEIWLEKAIPITEEQYYSTVHLDGSRLPTLITGSGAERFNFFSGLFNLDQYDAIKAHFVIVRQSIRDDSIRLDTLRGQLHEVDERIDNIQKVIDDRQKDYVDDQSKQLEIYRDERFRLREANRAIDASTANDTTYDEKLVRRLVKRESNIKQLLDGHHSYVNWKRANEQSSNEIAQLEKSRIKYTKEMLEYGIDKPIPRTISKLQMQLQSKVLELESIRITKSKLEDKQRSLVLQLDKLKQPQRSAQEYSDEATKLSARIESIEEQLEQFNNIEDGKCPTCGSEFDAKHLAKEAIKQTKLRDKLQESRRGFLSSARMAKSWEELTQQLESIKIPKYNANKHDKFENMLQICTAIVKLDSKLSRLQVEPKPKSAIRCANVAELKEEQQSILDQLQQQSLVKQSVPLATTLSKLGFESSKQVKSRLKAHESIDLDAMNREIISLTNAFEQVEQLVEKQASLVELITKLEKTTRQAKVIDALILAYGSTGIKRHACNDIAKRIEDNINAMSHVIFEEDFKFHLDVTDTNFHVTYESKSGTADVRNLSHAEKKCFTVLSMLGLLPELPSSLRTNILILDEMNANLDASAKAQFANELIPALNEIVPHVIVVSPLDDIYPNARVLKVIKKGSVSRLKWEE